jgi:hypothetical protein
MDRVISALRDQRDKAASEVLAIDGWECSRAAVAWAVEAMLANSPQSTTALGWLLHQMQALPDQEEATVRLTDFAFSIAMLARAEAKMNAVVPFPSEVTRAVDGVV